MPFPVARRPPPRLTRRAALMPLALLVPVLVGGCANSGVGSITPALQDDAPLSRDVGAALAERPELALFSISIRTLDTGTVRLSGRVDNDAQRHTAERAAAAVPGVRSVVNTIYVRD